MAEGILKSLLKERGVGGVTVSSAGSHGLAGEGAERSTRRVCGRNGIDLSNHVARVLDRDMIEESDLVVVMEGEHLDAVVALCPDAAGRTGLLTDFGGAEQCIGFIADPYGLPEWAHEACFTKIEKNVRGLFDALFEGQRHQA